MGRILPIVKNESAARLAQAHEFIQKTPGWLQYSLGMGGSNLSGGEKQWISIAHAILKNAPVILLDEATASLDPENEQAILDAISMLTRKKTVIVITHYLTRSRMRTA